jgi:diguanylate cyclase (GGDEF)-like protein/PAS domain S-box-containing protein
MNGRGYSSLCALRKEISDLYNDPSQEMALIRAAHLNAIVRHTPYMMAANFGNGLLIFWAFSATFQWGLILWWAALTLVSAVAVHRWSRRRGDPPLMASPRAVRRATLHAGALAAVWAALPLIWFSHANTPQQLLIAVLLAGMMSAGAFVLSSLPWASLTYVAIYAIAAQITLWLSGEPTFATVSALLCVYAPMVAIGSLFSWRKATALLKSQAEAVRQKRMVAMLLEDFEQNAGDALWETDAQGRLTHVSARLCEILGVAEDNLRSKLLADLISDWSIDGAQSLRAALAAGRPFRDLQLALSLDGALRHVALNAKPLMSANDEKPGWRGVLTDVTEKVTGLQMLKQLAHEDSLTGLANRFTFRDSLTAAIAQQRKASLFIIDLDHFKTINDTLGHAAGDALLQAVALRLSKNAKSDDVVARLGGDEFAVLSFSAADPDSATGLAQRVIADLTAPVDVKGRQLRVGASIGIAFCPQEAVTVETLLIRADTALYAAKAAGRGRYVVFTPTLGDQSRRRGLLETGLRRAVEQRQLALHWQPKIDIVDWRVIGAEGLLRWNHPEFGEIGPEEFIPIAEQCGLIEQLGDWALRAACAAASDELSHLVISVNVSPLQLRDGRFVHRVRDALGEFKLDPTRLELEITESAYMDDAEGALAQMHALRKLGVRIGLDDFGNGYASLAYLRRFPFDSLKIDRSFIHEALDGTDACAIIEMIAKLSSALGMRIVCEGVETAAQLATLTKAGCQEIQGYLVSTPLPLADFLLRQSNWGDARGYAAD